MTVSIITPLHNAETYISETIESVIAQTYQNWELIIVDDVSVDSSVEIVETFAHKDSRINLIKLSKNSGAAVARNTAIATAKGRYLAFLDSDDLWLADKLEKQLQFMQQTGCPFTYTAYEKIDQTGEALGEVGVPLSVTYQTLLKTCYLGCLTVMLDTQYFGSIKSPLIRKRQDYALWLTLLKTIKEARGLPEVLARYRIHDGSISANKLNTATYTWRVYRNFEKLSFIMSLYYFLHYAVRGLLRYQFPKFAKSIGILH